MTPSSTPGPARRLTRRRALKLSFSFSAASLMAGAAQAAPDTALPATEGPPSPAPPASPDERQILVWGDWGANDDRKAQTAVAQGMARYVKGLSAAPCCQFLLGDNFYGSFKGGVNSPRWKEQFEDMYPAAVFPGPCHALLGNHDYDDAPGIKIVAELQYARTHPGTRWHMPANWFEVSLADPQGHPLAECLLLDTNYKNRLVSLSADERARQLRWVEQRLAAPRLAPWLFVMGHHPLYSQGVHGDSKALIADFDGLFRKYGVQLYLAGHDHDLQHLEFEGHPTSFVISGGGGARARHGEMEKAPKKRGPYAQTVYGFSHLQLTRERFTLRHLDANGRLVHAFSKTPEGVMTLIPVGAA